MAITMRRHIIAFLFLISAAAAAKGPYALPRGAHRWRAARARLPRITLAELMDPDGGYFEGRLPFILPAHELGGGANWTAVRERWTLASFAAHFPDSIADYYPQNMLDMGNKPYLLPLREVLGGALGHPPWRDEQRRWRDRARAPYLQWRFGASMWRKVREVGFEDLPAWFVTDDHWMRECLGRRRSLAATRKGLGARKFALLDTYTQRDGDWPADNFVRTTHWRLIALGKVGSGMFLHNDAFASSVYHLHVSGRKRWFVCPPEVGARYIRRAGSTDAFGDPAQFSRDFVAAEKLCMEDVTVPGDILFYPSKYWHQTDNLEDDTVTLAVRRVDKHNYHRVAQELVEKCSGINYNSMDTDISRKWPGAQPPPSRSMCRSILPRRRKKIGKCAAFWDALFKVSPAGIAPAGDGDGNGDGADDDGEAMAATVDAGAEMTFDFL